MASALKLPDWKSFLRIARADNTPAVLSRRHIYILPTRYGWLYAIVLISMLVGSINYTLSLGFVLTFLLAGMGNMAMLHTWRNLAHLTVESHRVEPVFAGEDAVFGIVLTEPRNRERFTIAAHFDDVAPVYLDIPASSQATLKLKFPAKKRGWLTAPRITFFTEFPLSLFHVWAYANLDMRCLVYPHPALAGLPVPSSSDQGSTGAIDTSSGDDDFAGHRTYQLGDSPKRVDWKASSREQGLLTKQFQGEAQSSLWLDWALTPGTDNELRIRQLTRWIVDAHTDRKSYGLRLPRQEFIPNTGEAHYHLCLQALALLEI
jgi:uncharacterized protein (DUF58 family)